MTYELYWTLKEESREILGGEFDTIESAKSAVEEFRSLLLEMAADDAQRACFESGEFEIVDEDKNAVWSSYASMAMGTTHKDNDMNTRAKSLPELWAEGIVDSMKEEYASYFELYGFYPPTHRAVQDFLAILEVPEKIRADTARIACQLLQDDGESL